MEQSNCCCKLSRATGAGNTAPSFLWDSQIKDLLCFLLKDQSRHFLRNMAMKGNKSQKSQPLVTQNCLCFSYSKQENDTLILQRLKDVKTLHSFELWFKKKMQSHICWALFPKGPVIWDWSWAPGMRGISVFMFMQLTGVTCFPTRSQVAVDFRKQQCRQQGIKDTGSQRFSKNDNNMVLSWTGRYCHSLPGFLGGTGGKESTCLCRRCKRRWFDPWVGKIPWRRKWQPTPIFLPGKSHGQRNVVGYCPLGSKGLIFCMPGAFLIPVRG